MKGILYPLIIDKISWSFAKILHDVRSVLGDHLEKPLDMFCLQTNLLQQYGLFLIEVGTIQRYSIMLVKEAARVFILEVSLTRLLNLQWSNTNLFCRQPFL